jgi:hypothetical protein
MKLELTVFGRLGGISWPRRRETEMDDLTAQERQLILTLRQLRSFTVIIHKNARWRIVLTDEDACRTQVGEGVEFASAWDDLNGSRRTGAAF